MGDKRTYAWPIVLRCVSSEDGMTADWSKIPFQILERISNRIVNEVISVNRVVLILQANLLELLSGSKLSKFLNN